ncbi:MAG: hypothetical protein ACOCQN_00350 [Halanaerobiaceae bacterium]
MNTQRRPRRDKKAKCPFEQLLCVEFECIFDVDVEIDNDSIEVSCAGGSSPFNTEE